MCGRFSLHLRHQQIQHLEGYDVNIGEWIDQESFVPRYNIAPRTQAPVIRRRTPGSGGSPDDLVIQSMKWGLVPHWSKYEDKTLNTTNARSENLAEGGGMWNSIKGKKRCAVVCEGYYEWLNKGRDKLPHFTKHTNGRLMLLAGLYDSAMLDGQSEAVWSFTIVTTAASKDFSWLHDRQPVILSTKETLEKWLDTSSQTWSPDLSKFVSQPYHNTEAPLECYQVPKEVGKVGTESSTFIQPISARKDGIQAMFSKQRAQKAAPDSISSQSVQNKRKHQETAASTTETMKTDEEFTPVKVESSDDEIEIIEKPPNSKKLKVESLPKATTTQKKTSNPKTKRKTSSNNQSIASFFPSKS
ncbi:DUF159-domain-containing protein [Dendrothele bispora CBS 962.96]|uniref:DUF159-domain-containing protein n=1 Tax=Dendrothele bispora (strain CBS 962.96) TaxID=1314807 RepID=A0A4S8M6I0_DENBC|nr:DUF159-domain-containing protein [Dendrothele bispora CBS 962.96]